MFTCQSDVDVCQADPGAKTCVDFVPGEGAIRSVNVCRAHMPAGAESRHWNIHGCPSLINIPGGTRGGHENWQED